MTSHRYHLLCKLDLFNSHPHKEDDIMWNSWKIRPCFFQLTSSQGGWQRPLIHWRKVSLFNSHPHKEDDRNKRDLSIVVTFSTHILTRRMTNSCKFGAIGITFQLTSSQGGWLSIGTSERTCKVFNSHPHKEDDGMMNEPSFADSLFNSHPHKEDDVAEDYKDSVCDFSTHILTRRMTICSLFRLSFFIFQLTSSQGGWHHLLSHHGFLWIFNSHPHKENDRRICWRKIVLSFSTHILTRRMTNNLLVFKLCCYFSTHILTRRMTQFLILRLHPLPFQLTSSQGGWL